MSFKDVAASAVPLTLRELLRLREAYVHYPLQIWQAGAKKRQAQEVAQHV